MIGIYCITNTKNGMRYIGQSRNIERRFSKHLTNDKKLNTKLGKDIAKYERSDFSLTILQECALSELDELEKYWIKELRTFPDEYNMTPGGKDQVSNYDAARALTKKQVEESWKEGLCVKDILKKYKASSTLAIKNQLLELGYQEEEIINRGKKQRAAATSKKVAQLTLDGKVIKIFNSLNEAGRELNISSQNIGKVCKNERNSAGGYKWKYFQDLGGAL